MPLLVSHLLVIDNQLQHQVKMKLVSISLSLSSSQIVSLMLSCECIVWSAPGSTAPPGSYQTRFSLDGEDLESGTQPSDPLNGSHSRGPSASAPPTVQTQSKSFVSPQGARGGKKEGGGYHTLE